MTESALETRRTGVYRFFGFDGLLLYVGVSHDPHSRWAFHRLSRDKWAMIDHDRTTIEWFDDRPTAEAAERAAIGSEDPLWNCRGSNTPGDRLELERHVMSRHALSIPDDLWEELGQVVGVNRRSQLIRDLVAWHIGKPGARMPKRPPASE